MERRQAAPDLHLIAENVLADLRGDPGEVGSGSLDVIATVAELTQDDLIGLVVLLGRRVVSAETHEQ